MGKKLIRKYSGFAVSIIFLAYIFLKMDVDLIDVWENLKVISPINLFILMILYLIPYPLRATRAKLLLPKLDFTSSLGGVFIGYAANNVLPFRLGEVVRSIVVGKAVKEKRSTVLASVLVERVFDGFAIVMLLLIGASILKLPEWAINARSAGIILFSCALLGLFGVGWTHNFWEKLKPSGKLGEIYEGLLEGVKLATRGVGEVVAITTLSFMIWLIESSMYWYGFTVFNLAGTEFAGTFLNALFVLGIVNLGVLLPSSPGFVGVFEGFVVQSLNLFHVPAAASFTYAAVIHLIQFIPITIIGFLYLTKFGFKSLKQVEETAEEFNK
jgi:glycosyltransferase 2 family protein